MHFNNKLLVMHGTIDQQPCICHLLVHDHSAKESAKPNLRQLQISTRANHSSQEGDSHVMVLYTQGYLLWHLPVAAQTFCYANCVLYMQTMSAIPEQNLSYLTMFSIRWQPNNKCSCCKLPYQSFESKLKVYCDSWDSSKKRYFK